MITKGNSKHHFQFSLLKILQESKMETNVNENTNGQPNRWEIKANTSKGAFDTLGPANIWKPILKMDAKVKCI